MDSLYLAEDVRALDAAAIAGGVSGYELMRRAAAASLRELRARWPVARDLLVICGGGNNGGDGYLLARLARLAGLAPRVLAVVDPARLTGDAAKAAADCRDAGVPILAHEPRELTLRIARADVVVDALLGIGLVDNVRAETAAIIDAVNAARRPVLALDIPSGLCADSGVVRGTAIEAVATVTFIARKAGLYLAAGPDHAGDVVLEPLGVDARIRERAGRRAVLRLLDRSQLAHALPPRRREVHKGELGHVLVVAGAAGMPGAARLAGQAALRAGAGRVTVLTAPESVTAIAAGCAELMVRSLPSAPGAAAAVVSSLMAAADAVAIGPGLGLGDWGRNTFSLALDAACARGLPTVLDADALNLLADAALAASTTSATSAAMATSATTAAAAATVPLPAQCVLTPHPGEAARLLGTTAAAVQADRLHALRGMRSRHAATIVLKGAGTLVSDHPLPWLCPYGNPAMAAPGMGDVLTGVVATLLAQGLDAPLAARSGVLLHALAGDLAAARVEGPRRYGQIDRGLLASEMAALLPEVLAGGTRGP